MSFARASASAKLVVLFPRPFGPVIPIVASIAPPVTRLAIIHDREGHPGYALLLTNGRHLLNLFGGDIRDLLFRTLELLFRKMLWKFD